MPRRDADIDRLFQVPPEEFTRARNALASEAGSEGPAIRRLQKPPLAAWAVNQLFWTKRARYEALVESAAAVRAVHKAVLTGGHGDIRSASRAHDEALDAAMKDTLAIAAAGHKVTEATRQAISKTLRALPSDEPPGRLTRALQPGGFEMLAGITPAGRAGTPRPQPPQPRTKEPPGRAQPPRSKEEGARARELARAKETAANAARELRELEQQVRRQEFEQARAMREADKARARLNGAREELAAAEQSMTQADKAHAAADKARQAAERRSEEGAAALAAARDRAEAAQAALDALKSPSSRGR